MMKVFKSLFVLMLLSVLLSVHVSGAEVCEKYKGVKKVWWDGVELKGGQIGRLSIVNDTPLFKLDGEKKVFSKTLKAGEGYRIYAFKPGMLSVGGGFFVDRDNKVKYETPSRAKLTAAMCVHNPHLLEPKPTPQEPVIKDESIELRELTSNEIMNGSETLIYHGRRNYSTWYVLDPNANTFRLIKAHPELYHSSIPFTTVKNDKYIYSASANGPNDHYNLFIHSINEPSERIDVGEIEYFTINNKNLFTLEIGQDSQGYYQVSLFKYNLKGQNKELLSNKIKLSGGGPFVLQADDNFFYYLAHDSVIRVDLKTLEESKIPGISFKEQAFVDLHEKYIVVTEFTSFEKPAPTKIYNYEGKLLYSLNVNPLLNVIHEYENQLYYFNWKNYTIFKLNEKGEAEIVHELKKGQEFLGFNKGSLYTISYTLDDNKVYRYDLK
ncbi:hypothetical protein [Jeotgalibacillus sp. R-1-5s-1]|uniref:hypothetical protein n=1 Tax=Jeotgalibacillus sp. R-1-5s-1 TaxID=2555897 RepID=UPI001ABD315D|nr:hypothetical protein [Jeotgalibacillus sp. R-1-5s-1]